MRLIDADALKKKMQSTDRYFQIKQDIDEAPTVVIPAIPKWFSVDERLPERDVDVLAYVRGASFDYQRVMWIDDYSGKWVGYIGSGLYDKVIAWMPLPERYTKGNNEEVIEGV